MASLTALAVYPARTTFPLLRRCLYDNGFDPSAAGLDRIRRNALIEKPSKATIEDIVFRDGLVKTSTADHIVDTLKHVKIDIRAAGGVCIFDIRLIGLKEAHANAISEPNNITRDLMGEFAFYTGYPERVLEDFVRGSLLLPQQAVEVIDGAAKKVFGAHASHLTPARVPLNAGGAPVLDTDDRRALLDAIFPNRHP